MNMDGIRNIKVTQLTRGHVVTKPDRPDADKEVAYVDHRKDNVLAVFMDGERKVYFKDETVYVRGEDNTPVMRLDWGRVPVVLRMIEDGARLVIHPSQKKIWYAELKRDGDWHITIGASYAEQQRMIDYLAGVLRIPAPDINAED